MLSAMRPILILSVLFLLIFSCNSLRKSLDVNQGEVSGTGYKESIAIEYMKDKIILPVRINGKLRRFIFDTGAITVISESLHQEMDYPVMGEDFFYDIHKNRDTSVLVRTGPIQLGGFTFNRVPALVYAMDDLPWSCFQIDGIIGSNMLRNVAVQIDLRDSLFSLAADAQLLNHSMEQAQPMRLDRQSSPHIHVQFTREHEGFYLFDSGREGLFNLHHDDFRAMKNDLHLQFRRQGYGSDQMGMIGTGEHGRIYRIKVDSLLLAGIHIQEPCLEVTPNVAGIGSQLFQYGKLILDYKDKRFLLEPYDQPLVYQEPDEPGFGFNPVVIRDTLRVGLVWEQSLVDSLGVKPGDRILRINQYNYTDSLHQAFCKSFRKDVLKEAKILEMIYQNKNGDYKRVKIRRKR